VNRSIANEIERDLLTGDTDPHHAAWPGQTYLESAQRSRKDRRDALITEVLRRSGSALTRPLPSPAQTVELTRRKAEPMVRGLFPRAEQETVLSLVERSVVFLSPENISDVIHSETFDRAAWDLANLYLLSRGVEMLGPNARAVVGVSQNVTCFVSLAYFDEDDPFADFIVHEIAHIFHNCKRRTAGLPFTRRKEWLLDIAYRKRETFAYSCEAYSRVCERAERFRDRRTLAAEFSEHFTACRDDRVAPAEVTDIVREASTKRNGWKRILARCAPPKRTAGARA